MARQIERQPAAQARLGLKRWQFRENYILHDEADPFVPGTDGAVPRLRKVQLGPKAIGFFSDEIDRVIEALRCWRDQQAARTAARHGGNAVTLSGTGETK